MVFSVVKIWPLFRFFVVCLGLLLPTSLHVALGGYVHSGGILLWGVLIILWAVVIEETKLRYFWIFMYLSASILLSFWEQEFSLLADPFTVKQQVFLTLNLLISLTVCIFFMFDFNQSKLRKEKQKSNQLLLNILPHEIAEELKER